MRWIKKKALRLAFGLLLIAGLLYRLGPFEVAHTILSARPGHVLIAVSVYAVTFLILSTRWRMILHDMGESMPLTSAYKAFAGGMILSDLTPGRIGEISRPFLIRDEIDLSRGISSVVIDRFADILTIFLLGASGLLLFFRQSKYAMIIISMFLLAALTAAAIWRWRRAIPDRLRSSSPRIAPVAQLFESLDFIDDIKSRADQISPSHYYSLGHPRAQGLHDRNLCGPVSINSDAILSTSTCQRPLFAAC